MPRGGWRGIGEILITGRVFVESIPIGANTELVSVMGRSSMNNTIVARAVAGRKDSRVAPLLHPTQRDRDRLLPR